MAISISYTTTTFQDGGQNDTDYSNISGSGEYSPDYYGDDYSNYSGSGEYYYNEPQIILSHKVKFVVMGIIICSGVLLNIVSLLVFVCSQTMRHTRAAAFLTSLAIVDSLYLLFSIHHWMTSLSPRIHEPAWNINPDNDTDASCKVTLIGTIGSKICSAWITVAIATDRFITVKFPLRGFGQNRKWVQIVILVVIFTVSYVICLAYLPVYGNIPYVGCQYSNSQQYNITNWILHRLFSIFLPAVLMSIFTILTLITLRRAKYNRTRRLGSRRGSTKSNHSNQTSAEDRLTFTLMAVCVCFVVLRLPATIAYQVHRDHRAQPSAEVTFAILDILDYLNYAVNFFLYCFCGPLFRTEMMVLLRCKGTRRHNYQRSASFQLTRTFTRNTSVSGRGEISEPVSSKDENLEAVKAKPEHEVEL